MYQNSTSTKAILWRLTFPLFLLCGLLLMITVMPVQWILTGNYCLHQDGWGKIFYQWGEKLNF